MANNKKYTDGLGKTKVSFFSKLKSIFTGKVSEDFFEELEMALLSADISLDAVDDIIGNLRDYSVENGVKNTEDLKEQMKKEMVDILDSNGVIDFEKPALIMVVGINGVGKTTTIGKLANYFSSQGNSVVVAAADTFRAAAKEQLSVWADRNKVRIIKSEAGSDPSSVVFDAISSAKAKNTDILIVDTAGRLHTKVNLMEELKKMHRVAEREYGEANIYHLIVIDAVTGQNAISQVDAFDEAIGLDGVVITKMDGTAKGGIALTLSRAYALPIAFVGLGEGIDDLQPFDSKEFIDAII